MSHFINQCNLRVEKFDVHPERRTAIRTVNRRDGSVRRSEVDLAFGIGGSTQNQFDANWLQSKFPPSLFGRCRGEIRIADLFSGCGLMTLGVIEACRALQIRGRPAIAIDSSHSAADAFAANFSDAHVFAEPIENWIDRDFNQAVSDCERRFKRVAGQIDILVGGPPCQGHSDLNNHTRRSDPKNALLLKMVRATELLKPSHVIIENVRGIVHDKGNVVRQATRQLQNLGYTVSTGMLKSETLGVAQRRHRFFVVASGTNGAAVDVSAIQSTYRLPIRSFSWAAGDLAKLVGRSAMDTPSISSKENQRRMDYLFSNQLHDLPDSERPDCHRRRAHTYRSMYGRLHWDRPAQTITTGFGSMGQGRFVHPKSARTITPHEAARLQFIPDFFSFDGHRRGAVAEMIGNGVPPKLSYLIALEVLR